MRSQDATGDRAPDPSSPPGPTARRRALGPGPDPESLSTARLPGPFLLSPDVGLGAGGAFRPLPGSRAASTTLKWGTSFQGPGCYHITSWKVCQPAHVPPLHVRVWPQAGEVLGHPLSREPGPFPISPGPSPSPRVASASPGLSSVCPPAHQAAWSRVCVHVRSCPTPGTPWTAARCQASLSMGISRQEHWSGLPFSPPRDLPDPGIEPRSLAPPALAGRFFTTEPRYVLIAPRLNSRGCSPDGQI